MAEATIPDVDELSRRIAARGRGALVARLRTAYQDAANAHADIVSLEADRLEALVQNAADHADGLQWRRALAGLVADELGVSVAEALSHPAVGRAQSLIGAPSYEQSLAELITRPIPPPLPQRGYDYIDPDAPPVPIKGQLQLEDERAAEPEDVHSDELESAIADDAVVDLLPSPDPAYEVDAPTQSYELPIEEDEAEAAAPALPPAPAPEIAPAPAPEIAPAPAPEIAAVPAPEPAAAPAPEIAPAPETPPAPAAETVPGDGAAAPDDGVSELRVPAIHLGGVANLPTGGDGIDLRLSEQGLDIMRGPDSIIGRLPWEEIEALEVPAHRRRRRSGAATARLVVRTQQGDASFEIPGYSNEELRDRVELRMDRYRRG